MKLVIHINSVSIFRMFNNYLPRQYVIVAGQLRATKPVQGEPSLSNNSPATKISCQNTLLQKIMFCTYIRAGLGSYLRTSSIMTDFPLFSPVPPGKSRVTTSISVGSLPFKSFTIPHSAIRRYLFSDTDGGHTEH